MKKTILALMAIVALTMTVSAQTPATIADIGAATPTPGADDIYQTNWFGGTQTPDGLNYYFDNATPPGETFTTGSNPDGYIVTSLALQTADNSGQLSTDGQAYLLRFYAVSAPSNAALIGSYISQNFVFTDYDWLQWSNLGLALPPNSQFAYSFGRIGTGAGWENLGTCPAGEGVIYGSPASGDVALIPPSGGSMTLGESSNYIATFDLGLSIASGAPVANTPTVAPSSSVISGTAVTISASAVGATPLTYQWQTDGGTGGALTNIPGAVGGTLALNTTGWNPGAYQYAFVVANGSGSVTSAVTALGISYPTVAATLTDAGANILSGPDDVSQFIGGGSGNGLNYYDDNGASHGGNYIGQTFRTGTNSQGYYIDSVAFQTGVTGGSSATTTLQPYHLFIYSVVNGNIASLLAHYTNASFAFTFGDWLEWSGFSVALKPNSTYAYAFGRDASGTGWAALNYSPTNAPGPYTNGTICIIPQDGGLISPGQGYSAAVFDVGLLPIGVGPSPVAFANPLAVSPGALVTAGTQLTLTETASGQAPIQYYWQADGGTGTITNIPGNNVSNLVVNTAGWKPGLYQFDVIASNSFGFTKSAVLDVTVVYTNANATLTDVGVATPSVGANDVAQPVLGTSLLGGGSPDGLNYYFDNGNPPGQTFTTGSNPAGYVLNTVALALAGGSGSLPADGQGYVLRIYSVSGPNATLYATYNSETNFLFTDLDWLRWENLSVPLAANSKYAYSFGRVSSGSGWDNLSAVSNSPVVYNGGACVIPPGGGTITYSHSGDEDATFILGMDLAQDPVVSPPVVSPGGVIYAGTEILLTANVSGPGPYTYQWFTDGGTGTLTNVPGATGASLMLDTSAYGGATLTFELKVSNGAGTSTSETTTLVVSGASAPTIVTDVAASPVTIFAGGTINLSASFAGTLPITYQWKVDKGSGATNLVGETSTNLVLTDVTAGDAGTYTLTANNTIGPGSSTPVTVSVVPVPAAPFTVNFQWHSTEGGNDVGTYSGVAVPGYGNGTFWNQVIGPSAFTPGTYAASNALADDGITPTGITWSLTTGGSWDWSSAPVIPLLDSGASANYPTPQPFTLTLPNGLYNVVVFTCDGTQSLNHDSLSVITIGGQTQTATPTNDTAFVLGQTYLVFNNITVTDTTLHGTWAAGSQAQDLSTLNGIKLEYLGPAVTLAVAPAAGGQLQLSWTKGTLLQSANVNGPWATNTAASPYTVTPSSAHMFYKLIAP
jgi:hypothetical protein